MLQRKSADLVSGFPNPDHFQLRNLNGKGYIKVIYKEYDICDTWFLLNTTVNCLLGNSTAKRDPSANSARLRWCNANLILVITAPFPHMRSSPGLLTEWKLNKIQ